MSDASTVLSIYLPPSSSSKIRNLPLLICASLLVLFPLFNYTEHEDECLSREDFIFDINRMIVHYAISPLLTLSPSSLSRSWGPTTIVWLKKVKNRMTLNRKRTSSCRRCYQLTSPASEVGSHSLLQATYRLSR